MQLLQGRRWSYLEHFSDLVAITVVDGWIVAATNYTTDEHWRASS